MNHSAIIGGLYTAFAARDHEAMAACYHADAHFSDPVFPDLHGAEIAAMWHMLCEQGTDLVVTFSDVTADEVGGSARWEPVYTFTPTGRIVHNRIDTSFVFRDGLIARQVDTFDMWRWMRMALGTTGWLTGWTGAAHNKVRQTAGRNLNRFMDQHPEYRRPGSREI